MTFFRPVIIRSFVRSFLVALPLILLPAAFLLTGFNLSDTVQTGKASYYHDRFNGRKTSNGEIYDRNDFTAAHRTIPFGTIVMVTNRKTNEAVIVRINDRGPFKRSRVIDLSYSAAKKIDMVPFGVIPVRLQTLTYLDTFRLSDSLLQVNNVWNCFSEKTTLGDNPLFVWRTADWKHAFYMASQLSMEYKTDFVIRVENNGGKVFSVLVRDTAPGERKRMIKSLKQNGFVHCRLINI